MTLAVIGAVVAIVAGVLSSIGVTAGAVFFLWKVSGNVATSQAQLATVVAMVRDIQRERLPERVAVLEAVTPARRGKR